MIKKHSPINGTTDHDNLCRQKTMAIKKPPYWTVFDHQP
jgi:hypothetical protein